MYLGSNQELYDYLLRLAQELQDHGAKELGEMVAGASRHAAGLSTEFLGESRIALQHIILEGKNALTATQRADVEDVLQQLTAAINRSPQSAE
jgi:flagellar biosynthesis chaperone FliJ